MRNLYSVLKRYLLFKQRFYPFLLASGSFMFTYLTSVVNYYVSSVEKRCKCWNHVYYLVKFQQFKPRLSIEYFETQVSLLFAFGLSLQAFIRIKMNRMFFNLTTTDPSQEVRALSPLLKMELSI